MPTRGAFVVTAFTEEAVREYFSRGRFRIHATAWAGETPGAEAVVVALAGCRKPPLRCDDCGRNCCPACGESFLVELPQEALRCLGCCGFRSVAELVEHLADLKKDLGGLIESDDRAQNQLGRLLGLKRTKGAGNAD